MTRKNAVILLISILFVSSAFSFLGVNAAIYGPKEIPVIGEVYGWYLSSNQLLSRLEAEEKKTFSKFSTRGKVETAKYESEGKKKRINKKAKKEKKPDFIMIATAYVDRGQTKSQIYAGIGSVAVDPHIVPHGSILYIEGYGLALATDTGRLIKGTSVDVWFSSEKKAKVWGRRKVKVWKVGYADIKKILSTGGKYVNYFDNDK